MRAQPTKSFNDVSVLYSNFRNLSKRAAGSQGLEFNLQDFELSQSAQGFHESLFLSTQDP